MDYAIDRKQSMTKRFSASSAAQLIACPGSANLDLAIPGWTPPVVDEEKGAKGKGHRLHEYLDGTSALTAKDLRALADALIYMAELRSRRRFKVLTEQTIEATWLQTKPTTTVDVVLSTQDELHIVDYKTGIIPVSPINNEQLMFYALSFSDLAPKAKGAHLHIVQPWVPDGMNEWYVSATELRDFALLAQAAEQKIINGDLSLHPSDHCKFCPAYPHSRGDKGRPFCPPALRLLYPHPVDIDEILAL